MRRGAILACVSVILALTAFLIVKSMDRSARRFELTKQCIALSAIYKGWVKEGRPLHFDPEQWVVGSAAHYVMHTNTYLLEQRTCESLAAAYAKSLADDGILVVCKDGRLLWVPHPVLLDSLTDR